MIPHSRPTIGDTDIKGVIDVLRSGCLAQGEQVSGLEKDMTSLIGVKSAAAVSSGTAALHLALLALEVGIGDEIIIPSFACSALLHAVRYVGAVPVLADIDEGHFNIATGDVKKRLTRKTKALIVPHMFGQAANMGELLSFGLPIIEDCAQSLGSRYQGKMTGGLGTVSVFSFYATKLITTGEGGMVTSENTSLIEKIKDLRDYDEKDDDRVRYNYKMTDIQAALGRSQLRQLDNFIEFRRNLARRYDRTLQDMRLDIPGIQEDRSHIYYRYVFRLAQSESFRRELAEQGISCRRPVYQPLHHYLGLGDYPVSETAWREAVSLPIYPSLSEREIRHILSACKSFILEG